ncbi:MAG: type II secretion system F family protein [Aquificae bacterium]|nr:type II secretion system F family protein [Aquificota bacterium]
MPLYFYEGIVEGKRIKGKLAASSEEEALARLEARGILPLKVEPVRRRTAFGRRRVSTEELAFALLQLATLLEAGLPLTRALELVASQVESDELSAVFLKVKREIEEGVDPAEAFRNAEVFPEFLPEMLAAARTGENLELTFKLAGEYLQRMAEVKNRIVSSVTYPAFVIVFSFLAVVVAVKFVVPKLTEVLQSFGKEPPLVTKVVVFFTNLVLYSLALLPPLAALLYVKRDFLRSQRFGLFLLRVPILGKILLYSNLARFAKVMAMLLEAAVPLPEALRLAVRSVTLLPLREELEKLVPQVERGKSLSKLLKDTRLVPPLFANLVETGESGGELEKMFELLAETYEKETFRTIDFWIRMAEPISILLIALVVGVVVVSVMLPLAQLSTGAF